MNFMFKKVICKEWLRNNLVGDWNESSQCVINAGDDLSDAGETEV